MRTLTYASYYDKVYGCFLGKCIGGTAGGPAEGRKELLDYPLNEKMLHIALPNDDLDLQILWLEVLEEKGAQITARDLAEAFAAKVPYGPGEYGTFIRNYQSGIYPPYSGSFNNIYYKNGMGCPIRAEIWACLFPGTYRIAAHYVEMDGCQDHVRDSIDAEHFLAWLECEAFFCDSIPTLLERALEAVSMGDKLHGVIRDVMRLYREGKDWKYVRSHILRYYGHADCTNLYQNIGFVILSLLFGECDIRKTIRVGNACGYDTDCICATATSVVGMILGADYLLNKEGLEDTGLKISVHTRRQGGSIADLARDVCAAGISLCEGFGADTVITDYPEIRRIQMDRADSQPISLTVDYPEQPNLVLGHRTPVTVSVVNHLPKTTDVALQVVPPKGVSVSASSFTLHVEEGETAVVSLEAWVDSEAKELARINLFRLCAEAEGQMVEDTFGLVGGIVWKMYGPFLQNIRDLSHVPMEEGYGAHIVPDPILSFEDVVREYHLSGIADISHAFVDESVPFTAIAADGNAWTEAKTVCTGSDLFDIADLSAYEGPQVNYMISEWVCEEERTFNLVVGHTAPFRLWLNGTLIGGGDDHRWWTRENKHVPATFRKGVNTLVLKTAVPTGRGQYSLIPSFAGGLRYAGMAYRL